SRPVPRGRAAPVPHGSPAVRPRPRDRRVGGHGRRVRGAVRPSGRGRRAADPVSTAAHLRSLGRPDLARAGLVRHQGDRTPAPARRTGRRLNVMKRGLPGGTLLRDHRRSDKEARDMLYAGLDLSRKRLDVHLLEESGDTKEVTAVSPDTDALRTLVLSTARWGEPVRAAIESMNGARFVHDTLELAGWDVEIADAQKVKGLAPLACKTDRID